MKLDSDILHLYEFSEKEVTDRYISWMNDKEVCKYNSHGDKKYTVIDARKFLKSIESSAFQIVFAVYLKRCDLHIGNISLQKIDYKNGNAEVALLFGEREFWGNGYATEALKQLINLAMSMKIHRLYFGTHVDNIAMQSIGNRLSFLKEGVLKDAQFKNGNYNDVIIFGKIL